MSRPARGGSTRGSRKKPGRPGPRGDARQRPRVPAKAARAGQGDGDAHAAAEALGGPVRLQKVLARAGIASRRGAEALIAAGRVKVDDRVVTELGTKIDPLRQRVTVDGRPVAMEAPVYVVLNKPEGYVSSAEPDVDARGRKTVVSLLRGLPQRVYPVGRLDYHTRGVLLLTNDGDFAARLTHPRYKVPKTYHVKFQGHLDLADLQALREGVTLEDGTRTQPLTELFVIKETDSNTWVQLTLTQGLNRQIRRMGEAIGKPVLKLIRVAVGDVTTDGLAEGQWRHLRAAELADLRALTEEAGRSGPQRRAKRRARR